MGRRDHSITCETCGVQRGGINRYRCECEMPTGDQVEAVREQRPAPGFLSDEAYDMSIDFILAMNSLGASFASAGVAHDLYLRISANTGQWCAGVAVRWRPGQGVPLPPADTRLAARLSPATKEG